MAEKRVDHKVAAAEMNAVPQSPAPAHEVIWNTKYERHVPQPVETYDKPCGWIKSLAQCMLLKQASDQLVEVATLRGTPMIAVTQVRACVLKGEKAAYVVPCMDDPDAIPVRVDRSALYMNLKSVLGPAGLLVPKGFKDRYLTHIVGTEQGSPCGWALKIDLTTYEERQEVKPRSSKKSA